jgi:hypothetical protein
VTEDSWMEHEGAEAFLKGLKQQYNARVELLVNHAQNSTDAEMRKNWGHLNALASVIADMEAEKRAKRD